MTFITLKKINYILLLSVLILFSACSSSVPQNQERNKELQDWKSPNGKIKALSTIAMINDLVKQIGGSYVDTMTLIQGELDPHSYQLVKGDDEKLAYATLIFCNGLNLEHGPSLQHYLHHNEKVISLGDYLLQIDPKLILSDNNQLDPHIWMDVSLWMKTIPAIVEALSSKDPVHATYYQANGNKLMAEMQEVHAKIRKKMMAIPEKSRYLVTSHDAFNYFTKAYLASEEEQLDGTWKKRFAAPEGLAPESQLSTADITFIIEYLKKHGIHVLFPESNVSKDSIRKIVSAGKEKGLDVWIANVYLYADAMGPTGSDGDTYLKMILHNVNAISQCLNASTELPKNNILYKSE